MMTNVVRTSAQVNEVLLRLPYGRSKLSMVDVPDIDSLALSDICLVAIFDSCLLAVFGKSVAHFL